MLNKARMLPRLLRALEPPADEVLAIARGSHDGWAEIAVGGGLRVTRHKRAGRATQISGGVRDATMPLVSILHPTDRLLPDDAVRGDPPRVIGGPQDGACRLHAPAERARQAARGHQFPWLDQSCAAAGRCSAIT
jgi:hypothetical protein